MIIIVKNGKAVTFEGTEELLFRQAAEIGLDGAEDGSGFDEMTINAVFEKLNSI